MVCCYKWIKSLTSMSGLFIYKLRNLLKHAEIGASMCLDALKANLRPYDHRLYEVRGFVVQSSLLQP